MLHVNRTSDPSPTSLVNGPVPRLSALSRLLGMQLRPSVAVAVSFAGPLVAAAIMVAFRSHVANTSLALIMVAVVVVVVAPGRRLSALIAGASAGVWFDFFLTRPYESFTITRSNDLQTTLLLFAVAVAVGEIAAHNRRNRMHAVLSTADLRGIRSVAHLLASGASVTVITEAASAALKELLALESVRFQNATDIRMPYVEQSGAIRYSNYFTWDHTHEGLPAKTVMLPVEVAGRRIGRFALQGPAIGVPLSTDRLLTAVALADLTAASITESRRTGARL